MKQDYLWDQHGESDPEVLRLEQALAQFRYSEKEFVIAQAPSVPRVQPRFIFWRTPWAPRFAAMTILFLALSVVGFLSRVTPPAESTLSGWNVSSVAGSPMVGSESLGESSNRAAWKIGQLLVTGKDSRASINLESVGEVYVDPGSRVRLVSSDESRERLSLELGTIHAAIWATPGKFEIETPSATAIDLGCAYTLQVNEDGSGSLHTTMGWVGFHQDGHDAFIPAGAMCLTKPKRGPGTPYFEDAARTLRDALNEFDSASNAPEIRREALRTILDQARTHDAFTLWHLLSRVDDTQRVAVYQRLASLVQPPAGVTRAGTLALDPQMMDAWWNAFDLGDISVWRFWEQNNPPAANSKRPVNTVQH
jgi:hypothetical protein